MKRYRPLKYAQEIKKEITKIILKEMDYQPEGTLLTITDVELTDDLQYCRIFYSIYGNEQEKIKMQERITELTPYFRKMIANKIRFRRVPEISFRYDKSVEEGERIDQIFDEIKHRRNNR